MFYFFVKYFLYTFVINVRLLSISSVAIISLNVVLQLSVFDLSLGFNLSLQSTLEGSKDELLKKVTLADNVHSFPTPMNDQDLISPYNISTVSSRHVMRIKKDQLAKGLLVDSKENSLN